MARVTALAGHRTSAPAKARESVLAIGAHPGDIEIGAGGALLAHRAASGSPALYRFDFILQGENETAFLDI